MAHDALGAHARDELGISHTQTARPLQAALASAASFMVGAALPLIVTLLAGGAYLIPIVAGTSLGFLALLGGRGAGRRRAPCYRSDACRILGRARDGDHRRRGCIVRNHCPLRPSASFQAATCSGQSWLRELAGGEVRVRVAANPCFGLDFKAVDFIHDLLVETRNNGAAVLLVTEDLAELLTLADRIFVMTDGVVAHETTPDAVDLAASGRQMAGHH
jgi:hypothetical protein